MTEGFSNAMEQIPTLIYSHVQEHTFQDSEEQPHHQRNEAWEQILQGETHVRHNSMYSEPQPCPSLLSSFVLG